jgi:hypothetical protein
MNDSIGLKQPGLKARAFASFAGIALSSIVAGVGLLLTPSAASAQAAYGSYIGFGGSVGLTDGGIDGGSSSGGLISVRYRFLEAPISLRGQVLIGETTAFVPTVSYDIPLDWQTDVYLGAGVAIQDSNSNTSPLGNQTAFVLQPGVDYNFPYSNLVVFGNAIIAFDAYKDSNDNAASVQAGVGVRF